MRQEEIPDWDYITDALKPILARKMEIYSVDAVKSRKEVMAEMPQLHDEWEELQAMKARITERRQAAQVAPTEQVGRNQVGPSEGGL